MGYVGQVKNPAYEPSGAVSGLPWKDLGTYGYGGSFLTARHITEALMPTAIPRARRTGRVRNAKVWCSVIGARR